MGIVCPAAVSALAKAPPKERSIPIASPVERSGVDLIVNTPWGKGARTDGYLIRRKALMHGVPCITTLAAAGAAIQGIESRIRGGVERVNSLQGLYAARA
jgi:carbamoyl-phosphate synthase large subunit